MPPQPSSIPHASARALFPQECTHDTHYLNHKGDLYTALITGGDRVLLLKNGTVVAQSGPLFDPSALSLGVDAEQRSKGNAAQRSSAGGSSSQSASGPLLAPVWRVPCVYVVSICRFTDDVLRVAVATTAGIFIFEFDDAGVLWQDTRPSSFWRTAERDGEDGVFGAGAAPGSLGSIGSSTNRFSAMHGRGAAFQPPAASPLGLRGTGSSTAASSGPATAENHLEKHSGMAGRLRWRRVAFSLDGAPPGATAARGSSAQASPYRGSRLSSLPSNSSASGVSVVAAPVRVATPARPSTVRAMDFVSEGVLCVVLETETVLIVLGNSSAAAPRGTYGAGGASGATTTAAPHVADRVVWRTLGAYRSLAVCRVNHHIALALGHSSMVVFPSRIIAAANGRGSGAALPGDDVGGLASAALSTSGSSFFATHPTSGDASPQLVPAAVASTLRGMLSDSRSSSVLATPAFSPTNPPLAIPALPGGAASAFPAAPGSGPGVAAVPPQPSITLARQGLTTSVGIYHITDMRWHHVSSHTLLCVTCSHPREESAFMMLYTVQSLSSTRRYTNVMEEHGDGGWGLCRGGYDGDGVMDGSGSSTRPSEHLVQLVPAGVIALTYTSTTAPSAGPAPSTATASALMAANTAFAAAEAQPDSAGPTTPNYSTLSNGTATTTIWGGARPPPVAEMHTSLVPNFSRSAEANSMGSRMEFVHVEGDGTVRTSSYSFGRQKHASFAKQRAVGLACTELLQPLLHLYGSLVRITVLPTWRTRPIELGHHTGKQPQAVEVLLNASRRYRMVLRFTSGVLLSVMVDLSAALYRVESYLALGCAPLLSLRPISPIPELDADDAHVTLSQTAIGTTTMLLAGLLDFPIPTSPPAGKPKRLLAASPSFLEEGEVDTWRHAASAKASRSSSVSSVPSAAVPQSRSASLATGLPAPPRAVWGVALLQVEPSGLQARVLTIAPLSDVDHVPGVMDAWGTEAPPAKAASDGCATTQQALQQTGTAAAATQAAGGAGGAAPATAVTTEDVERFIREKCPEKLKFLPALLKATQQDAGRLLTQLQTKYGPLEKSDGEVHQSGLVKTIDMRDAAAPLTPPRVAQTDVPRVDPYAGISPCVLRSGCLTEEGEVVLLLGVPNGPASDVVEGDARHTAAPAAVVRVRPPCLEAFAPVHRLVAAGSSQIPFVPVAAEYTAIPSAVQRRWWSPSTAESSAAPVAPPPCASVEAQSLCTAYRLCRRVSERREKTRVVRCEVVRGRAPTQSYIRVRSPLTPEGGDAAALTALQHLSLPQGVASRGHAPASPEVSGDAPLEVEDVKGTLLVNSDIVVGVLCRGSMPPSSPSVKRAPPPSSALTVCVTSVGTFSTLYLYGCPAVQSLTKPRPTAQADGTPATSSAATPPTSAFVLEAALTGVAAFYLSTSGEVVVLRQGDGGERGAASACRFERWLRCFPDGGGSSDGRGGLPASQPGPFPAAEGYSYMQDLTWCPPCSHARLPGSGELPAVTAITTMEVAGAWEANVVGLSSAAKLTSSRAATRPIFYATTDNSFIHLRQMPLRSGGDARRLSVSAAVPDRSAGGGGSVSEDRGTAEALAGMPQYHPDAVMQLIGMARWSVLAKVLRLVLDSAKAALAAVQPHTTDAADPLRLLFSQPPDELARRLCTSAVARGFHDRPQVVQYDDVHLRVAPPRLSAAALQEDVAAGTATTSKSASAPAAGAAAAVARRLYDLTAACGTLFAELTEVLPQITLAGLSSHEQLNLLCIVQSLRDVLPLSRSVDEAAARYLFFTRLMSLGRRLRLPNIDVTAAGAAAAAAIPGVPINSVLYFEVGRTATRTVSTAAFLWAAMSDSQSTLVSLLFDKTNPMHLDGGGGAGAASLGAGEVAWEQVEQSGAAFWLRSAAELRAMADRVARHQYQRKKELTACALMYCTARKVSTLAALAKAQNNVRLCDFFSRDFAHDERHRAAASANAFAAISKNMPQYGAAFFLLAGDVRSAVQVLLQRCRDPFLALFVLRAAGEGVDEAAAAAEGGAAQMETLLQWYAKQRASEVDACGPLDMWETACLSWMDVTQQTLPEVAVQRRIAALQRIAAHPTAHPEALCALRYARDGVAALAYRGDRFLSPAREVVCLLRLGRYCLAHRLNLNGYLHYRDAEGLLRGLCVEAAEQKGVVGGGGAGVMGGGARRPAAPAKMAADYNTGTLTFRGFDSDDDDGDDDGSNGGRATSLPGRQDDGGAAGADAEEEVLVLNDDAVAAVQAEMRYAYICTGATRSPVAHDAAAPLAASVSYEDVLRRMLLCFTAASSFMSTSSVSVGATAGTATTAPTTSPASTSSFAGAAHGPFQDLLAQLLRRLTSDMSGSTPAATESVVTPVPLLGLLGTQESAGALTEETLPSPLSLSATTTAASPTAASSAAASACRPVLNGSIREPMKCAAEGWYSLCIPLLHLLLSKVALQEANYLVLLALQRIPVSTEGVLEAAEQAGLLHGIFNLTFRRSASSPSAAKFSPLHLPLTAFFRLLGQGIVRHYTDACEVEEERQGGHWDGATASPARVSDGDSAPAAKDEDGSEDPVHHNMFEALMAAAAAAERSGQQSGASSPGARRLAYPAEGEEGDAGDDALRGDAASLSALTADAQVAMLLSCCQSQLQLRLMEHLRHLTRAELQSAVHTPTTQRAVDAGVLYSDPLSPTQQAMLIQRRVLLATMLLDVTVQWGALAEETMLRLHTALPCTAPGPLTDPNGVFLEVRLDVLRMRTVLVTLLAGPRGVTEAAAVAATSGNSDGGVAQLPGAASSIPSAPQRTSSGGLSPGAATTTWLEDNTVMLLDLCSTQLELYWALPSHTLTQCRLLARPTRAALRLLRRSTASHTAARQLLDGMLRPVHDTPPLSQRSHTAPLTSQLLSTPQQSAYVVAASPLTRASTSVSWATGRESAAPEGSEHGGGGGGADPDELYCPALAFLQLAWMRRHHTHALLRALLLGVTLDMGRDHAQRPLLTDRLILTQHSHAITGLQFDASSCDSVVCTTEAGTFVSHGVRELLAGDNEEALWVQSTERNLATAAFTLGLAAQQTRLQLAADHGAGHHTPEVVAALTAKSVLESRPRCAVAANAMPATHPHLPFFVARHRDGHLDLYPYASQECLASFCCALRHGQGGGGGGVGGGAGSFRTGAGGGGTWATWGVGPSTGDALGAVSAANPTSAAHLPSSPSSGPRVERYAVTPVAFSPNGYIIAAGLSDGSVAGWRFAAAAVESAPAFTFPQLFAPYGIRACAFCGDRSSLMAVVGLVREPHPHPRVRITAGKLAGQAGRLTNLATSFAVSPVSPPVVGSPRGAAAAAADAGELVGELLLLDTMLDEGAVTARCALPFVPSYAVYLTALRAVLLVSSEGLMATYCVPSGRLAIIATRPIGAVLEALPGSTVGEGAPGKPGLPPSPVTSAARGPDSSAVSVTCVARSPYDPLVAVGTSVGLVLLLHLRHISAAMHEAERRRRDEGEDVFVYYPPAASGSEQNSKTGPGKRRLNPPVSSPVSATSRAAAEVEAPAMGTEFLKRLPQESVLMAATCVQVSPQVQSRCAVQDMAFSPSMLLAGLRDGKVMAVAVIAHATRTRLTAGSGVAVDLLEVERG